MLIEEEADAWLGDDADDDDEGEEQAEEEEETQGEEHGADRAVGVGTRVGSPLAAAMGGRRRGRRLLAAPRRPGAGRGTKARPTKGTARQSTFDPPSEEMTTKAIAALNKWKNMDQRDMCGLWSGRRRCCLPSHPPHACHVTN
jgi:hypothetical protein